MTEVLERTEPAPDPARTPARTATAGTLGRRGMAARLGADVRLARRQVWRTRGSSLLVLLLVALPVTAMVAGAVFWQSHIPTRQQEVDLELGSMQARIQIVGGEDPSRVQAVDSTWDWSIDVDVKGDPVNPEKPAPESPAGFVPAGAELFEVHAEGSVRVRSSGGIAVVSAQSGTVWHEAFRGRYLVVDGETPTQADEAMATPGALARLGIGIGDDVVLPDSGDTFTITGTLRQADMREAETWLFLPEQAGDLVEGEPVWFAAGWQPGIDELSDLNRAGFVVYARDLVLSPPPGSRVYEWRADAQQVWGMLATGGIVAAFSGYLVVLLAGAAFAVAARRQQRSLAVAASVGATRADVFRIVVLQGTVLGLAGGLLGMGAGIGLAAALIAVTDQGAVDTFWGVWGFNVPWLLVIAIVAFAVIVGTISAVAPARSASRGDVLGALRGARRPVRLDTRRPVWGLVLMLSGIGASIGGALGLLALDLQEPIQYDHPLRVVAGLGVILGPIVFQIGVLLAGHWIITMASRALSKVSLAARVASRDAAANPSRVVPAFAAIAACVFIASFALSSVAVNTAASVRDYWWSAPLGSVVMEVWGEGEMRDVVWERAQAIATDARADRTIVMSSQAQPTWDGERDTWVGDAVFYHVASQPTEECPECGGPLGLMNGEFRVVSPDDLEAAVGVGLTDSEVEAFRAGTAFTSGDGWANAQGRIEITGWSEKTYSAYGDAMNEVYGLGHELPAAQLDALLPDPDERLTVPTIVRDDAVLDYPRVLLSPETAESLGIPIEPSHLMLLFDELQPDATYDAIVLDAENAAVADASIWPLIERGPQAAEPWLWLISAATIVLVIGAGAVCLGLARFERRPDDATLTAIGGSRSVRRRINGWQAVIIVGIGSFVGTIAGQLPMWGIAHTSSQMRYWADAPWLWLAVLAVGLPLLVMGVSWLVPPRHPDLTRRTAIA